MASSSPARSTKTQTVLTGVNGRGLGYDASTGIGGGTFDARAVIDDTNLDSDLSTDTGSLATHAADTSTHGVTTVAGVEDITFETLDAASDVGTAADTVAAGDHTHA